MFGEAVIPAIRVWQYWQIKGLSVLSLSHSVKTSALGLAHETLCILNFKLAIILKLSQLDLFQTIWSVFAKTQWRLGELEIENL